MGDKPTYALLLDWMNESLELAPTSDPGNGGGLWVDGGSSLGVAVKFNRLLAPVITVQPTSQSVSHGATATFTVTASYATSYQWQKQESGAGAWANVSGATSSSYTTGTLSVPSDNTDKYRVIVTGAGGSTTSDAVTLTVAYTLPTGAIGEWYAENYSSSPRRVVPNSASGTAVSANLFPAPRRQFANSIYWTTNGTITFSDASVTAPDGSSDATTAVCSGNWLIRINAGANLPAGDYTVACNVKRNTGSDQLFCFSKDNTSTRSSQKTATSSWQRFTYAFTLASSTAVTQISLCSIDGSTAANLQICDMELYSGSSDLGPGTPAGHMYLGSNHYATEPAVASNEIALDNQGYGQIQLAAASTISSGVTFMAVIKKTATASAYHSVISKMKSSWGDFTPVSEISLAPTPYIGGVANLNLAGLNNLSSLGYHVLTWRYNGSTREMWIDDCKLHSLSGSVSSFTIQDFNLGIVNSTSLYAGEKLYAAALWDSALSDADVLIAKTVLAGKATAAGLTIANIDRVYCAEGDSISGAAATCWPYVYGPNASLKVFGKVFAVSSSTIASMTSRAATLDAVLPADRTGRKFILSVLIGANDLVSLGAATYLTNLGTYLDARVAAGWTVALCTPTPSTASGFNTQRALILSTMRGWVGTKCAAIIDFAADATMGPDAAASNGTLYSDGTHPTTTGQNNLEVIARSVLNGL